MAYPVYRFIGKAGTQDIKPSGNSDSASMPAPVITEYGLPVDSFIIVSGIIEKNQTLAGLLDRYHVLPGKIARIVERSAGVFELRQIRAGNSYTLFSARDSLQSPRYFVYEHTPVNYLFIDLTDSVKVRYEAKDVDIITRSGSGVVTSSLWEAMLANNLDPVLAVELSEIYAWTIDFFGLYDGDSFKVIYDEQYTDTTFIGLGKIHGACFRHAGQDHYAIPFIQDNVESYFDQEGNSLRRTFLKAPLRFSRISSRYSHNRLHPILKIRRPHLAVDYAAPVGTPVYAVGDGKVIEASFLKNSGNMLKIRHNSVYTTAYLHLSHFARGIRQGTTVRQGDLIGYVGSTGLSTGPHLDFRFYKNGSPVDPLKVKAPPVEPVRDTNRMAFDSVKTEVISKLDHIHAGPDSTDAFSSR
jgi:murein DD-endopeptidase MepM/ murein hydrolase activator NlpD